MAREAPLPARSRVSADSVSCSLMCMSFKTGVIETPARTPPGMNMRGGAGLVADRAAFRNLPALDYGPVLRNVRDSTAARAAGEGEDDGMSVSAAEVLCRILGAIGTDGMYEVVC